MGHISKPSLGLIHRQKATSLSWAPKRHYRFWRVELCCHLIRTCATVIHQEHKSMRPWDTGQVEIFLLLNLWVYWNRVCSCGAWDKGSWATGACNHFWGASTVLCSPRTQETEILSCPCYGFCFVTWEILCLNVPTCKRGHWCWLAL